MDNNNNNIPQQDPMNNQPQEQPVYQQPPMNTHPRWALLRTPTRAKRLLHLFWVLSVLQSHGLLALAQL